MEVNPIRDFDIKCLAKSPPTYINVKALLKSFLFDTAPEEGPTNLINVNFSVVSVTSGESASLKAVLLEMSITDPHDSTIASETGKATMRDILC